MATIPQLNQIFSFLKYILSAMGFLVAGAFYMTYYGVNYTNNTTHRLDTLSSGIRQINANQVKYQATSDKHFEMLDDRQADMQLKIQYIMDNIGRHSGQQNAHVVPGRLQSEYKATPTSTPVPVYSNK